jgi:hypothetical protein
MHVVFIGVSHWHTSFYLDPARSQVAIGGNLVSCGYSPAVRCGTARGGERGKRCELGK